MDAASLLEVLAALGDVLEARNRTADVAVIGGGALLLSGIIERPTRDLDAVALLEGFAALTLRVAGRLDQIHFKLYAAVDQGPDSKHVADLNRLKPTTQELTVAARWCRTHDASEEFAGVLSQALRTLGDNP